jgi:hypothetical protein
VDLLPWQVESWRTGCLEDAHGTPGARDHDLARAHIDQAWVPHEYRWAWVIPNGFLILARFDRECGPGLAAVPPEAFGEAVIVGLHFIHLGSAFL